MWTVAKRIRFQRVHGVIDKKNKYNNQRAFDNKEIITLEFRDKNAYLISIIHLFALDSGLNMLTKFEHS